MDTCAYCGTGLSEGDEFCLQCGAKIDHEPSATAESERDNRNEREGDEENAAEATAAALSSSSLPPVVEEAPAATEPIAAPATSEAAPAGAPAPPWAPAPPPGAAGPPTPYGGPQAAFGYQPYSGGPPWTQRWDGRPLTPDFAQKKILAGILAILFGQLGIHKFILGYTTAGIIMLAITLVSYALTFVIVGIFGVIAMAVIGIVEGILYLTKSDDEFVYTYGVNKREWF